MAETIGSWTSQQLARFITQAMHTLQKPASVQHDEIRAVKMLIVSDQMQLSPAAITYLKHKLGL